MRLVAQGTDNFREFAVIVHFTEAQNGQVIPDRLMQRCGDGSPILGLPVSGARAAIEKGDGKSHRGSLLVRRFRRIIPLFVWAQRVDRMPSPVTSLKLRVGSASREE